MKYDGHVKLTAKALEKIKRNCPIMTSVCNAPMFKDTARVWLNDKDTSNSTDNYSSAVHNYVLHSITPDILAQVTLPDAVSFVDLSERWTHEAPKGQRYHFMRANGESQAQAYLNGVNFIKKHTENWVNAAKEPIKETKIQNKPLQNATWRNTRMYVKELALALHCLQDSFSPGHVKRGNEATPHHPGVTSGSAPISKIFIYSNQNHDMHGTKDYKSGSPESGWGASAVNASVALMAMGIISIPSSSKGLTGWPQFVSKWLPQTLM